MQHTLEEALAQMHAHLQQMQRGAQRQQRRQKQTSQGWSAQTQVAQREEWRRSEKQANSRGPYLRRGHAEALADDNAGAVIEDRQRGGCRRRSRAEDETFTREKTENGNRQEVRNCGDDY